MVVFLPSQKMVLISGDCTQAARAVIAAASVIGCSLRTLVCLCLLSLTFDVAEARFLHIPISSFMAFLFFLSYSFDVYSYKFGLFVLEMIHILLLNVFSRPNNSLNLVMDLEDIVLCRSLKV